MQDRVWVRPKLNRTNTKPYSLTLYTNIHDDIIWTPMGLHLCSSSYKIHVNPVWERAHVCWQCSMFLTSPTSWDIHCNSGFTFTATHSDLSWPLCGESDLAIYHPALPAFSEASSQLSVPLLLLCSTHLQSQHEADRSRQCKLCFQLKTWPGPFGPLNHMFGQEKYFLKWCLEALFS